MRHLVWDRQSGEHARACNARRTRHGPGEAWWPHDHDYVELFWLERGVLEHRWDASAERLVAGDAIALVPGERHQARVGAGSSATVVNVSLGAAAARALARRYRADGLIWPWSLPRARRRLVLDQLARRQLAALIDLVDTDQPSGRDALILGLGHALRRVRYGDLDRLPPWLLHAVHAELEDETERRFGVSALARRLACSREHLSRVARAATGRPLVDVLTDYRLDLAAADLRTRPDDTIPAIAGRYRFHSLSWFHQAFRRRYACTPAAWRGAR